MTDVRQRAAKLTLAIRADIIQKVGCKPKQVIIDGQAVLKILQSCWWSGNKSRMFLINPDGDLIQFSHTDTRKELPTLFAHPVANKTSLLKHMSGLKPEPPADIVLNAPWDLIISHLKTFNQRESLTMCVDMFANNTRVDVGDDVVNVMFTHKPFESDGIPDPNVIADYKKHFPGLDDFLEFLVASRFAVDRKRSYIWFHCDSDWGKNLLIDMIKDMGGVTSMSVKEAEAAFEGRPVGLSSTLFKRSIALVFDEFKTVKSELKQLQNTLTINPKNQLRTEVQIYTKVFMSKEAVPSLAGDHGIEDQFANRFSYIRGTGSIAMRPVYKAKGIQPYASALQVYICDWLNKRINHYIGLGEIASANKAEQNIEKFRNVYGIDNFYDRFSESLMETADQFGAWILRLHKYIKDNGHDSLNCDIRNINESQNTINLITERVIPGVDGLNLKAPGLLFDTWAKDNIDYSSLTSVSKAKDNVFVLMSADGKGNHPARPHSGGRSSPVIKCIKLKNKYGVTV